MDWSRKKMNYFLARAEFFEINQRLMKIAEQKDAPYVDYISKLLMRTLNFYLTNSYLLIVVL